MTDGKDTSIPSALLDAAREKAKLEDITVSQYVRRCLMKWVGMLPADDETQEESQDQE